MVPKKVETILEKNGLVLISDLPMPTMTVERTKAGRELCKQNLCGNYNKCWTCPPAIGSESECVNEVLAFSCVHLIILKKDDVDCKDRSVVEGITKEFQDAVRGIGKEFKASGNKVLVLAGGNCMYCARCTYPDKACPFPEEQVSSVSGYGVDVGKFLEENDMVFEFKDRVLSLFGFVFTDGAGKV